eukprot:11528294-Alexandrium_andersonii.AAC.1
MRILFYSRLLRYAGQATRALAQANAWQSESWSATARADLDVLWCTCEYFHDFPEPSLDQRPWGQMARDRPG